MHMSRGGRLVILLLILIAVVVGLAYFLITQPQVTPLDVTAQPTVEPKRRIVTARIDIESNTVLTDTETFLTTTEIPESEFNNQYFTEVSQLRNKQTVQKINFNDPVRRSDVTDPGLSILIPTAQPNQPRPKAYPVQVDNLSGVADQIRPGDFVDVLVSIEIVRTIIRPSFNETGQIVPREEQLTGRSVKALIQNVQVLQILKPAVPEGTPGAQGSAPQGSAPQGQQGPPQTDASGQPIQPGQQTAQPTGPQTTGTFVPGDWLLVLALTDQQAEIVKFSVDSGTISLALRGRGDTAVDTTLGSTLSLLVERFGLPLPDAPAPDVVSSSDLTPVPTTSAPVGPTTPTPTP
jgi:pilus assembly protein CpaB